MSSVPLDTSSSIKPESSPVQPPTPADTTEARKDPIAGGVIESKDDTSSHSELELPESEPPKMTLKGAGGGVSSSESAAPSPSKTTTSVTLEHLTANVLKNKGLMMSSIAAEQMKGAKYFVCLSTTVRGKVQISN